MNNYPPRGLSNNQMNMNRGNQFNYGNNYQPSVNLIPQQDYNNNGSLVHNNIDNNIFNEYMNDYTLHIDSYDRDLTAFPSAFKFIVSLGGAGTSTEKKYDESSNTFKTINYTGAPDPRIQRNFHNVKQIILDRLFFPQFCVYTRTIVAGVPYYSGKTAVSSKFRYLIVKIKELDNNKVFSTNNRVSDDSFIIYKDKDLGGSSTEIWLSSYCNKRVYPKSSLKNLDKLTVEIVDPEGNLLKHTYVIDGDATQTEYDMPLSELTGPNQTKYEFAMQMTISLYENEIKTNVNYR
jgi:hypothetical protein